MYAVIMAGGRGSRFWPRSRKRQSKQTLNIVGRYTMIQDTVYRLRPAVTPNQTLVITNDLLEEEIRRQLPTIPPENILVEPKGRSTAPCVGLAAIYLRRIAPDLVMATFPADHLIRDVSVFHRALKFAEEIAAKDGKLVTFGVRPERADTGFGYIQSGEIFREQNSHRAYQIARFVEKPDLETAKTFVADSTFHINSGMFVWRVDVILEEIRKWLPDMYEGLEEIASNIGTPLEFKALGEIFPKFQSISIDHGVMEKSERSVMVPADFGWNDLGSWSSLYDLWPKDADQNAHIGRHLALDTKNCLVYSPHKFVATLGVSDLVIVETDDALLVCHKDAAQQVSRIIDALRERKIEEFL